MPPCEKGSFTHTESENSGRRRRQTMQSHGEDSADISFSGRRIMADARRKQGPSEMPDGSHRWRERAMGNTLSEFLEKQRCDALGSVNKWYCSQHHGYEVTDPEVLLAYYIR